MTYSARYVPKGSKTPPPGMESNRTSVFICLKLIGGSKTNFFCVTLLSVFDVWNFHGSWTCKAKLQLHRKKSQEGSLDQLGQKGL